LAEILEENRLLKLKALGEKDDQSRSPATKKQKRVSFYPEEPEEDRYESQEEKTNPLNSCVLDESLVSNKSSEIFTSPDSSFEMVSRRESLHPKRLRTPSPEQEECTEENRKTLSPILEVEEPEPTMTGMFVPPTPEENKENLIQTIPTETPETSPKKLPIPERIDITQNSSNHSLFNLSRIGCNPVSNRLETTGIESPRIMTSTQKDKRSSTESLSKETLDLIKQNGLNTPPPRSRRRRALKEVNYTEPKLGTKMRNEKETKTKKKTHKKTNKPKKSKKDELVEKPITEYTFKQEAEV